MQSRRQQEMEFVMPLSFMVQGVEEEGRRMGPSDERAAMVDQDEVDGWTLRQRGIRRGPSSIKLGDAATALVDEWKDSLEQDDLVCEMQGGRCASSQVAAPSRLPPSPPLLQASLRPCDSGTGNGSSTGTLAVQTAVAEPEKAEIPCRQHCFASPNPRKTEGLEEFAEHPSCCQGPVRAAAVWQAEDADGWPTGPSVSQVVVGMQEVFRKESIAPPSPPPPPPQQLPQQQQQQQQPLVVVDPTLGGSIAVMSARGVSSGEDKEDDYDGGEYITATTTDMSGSFQIRSMKPQLFSPHSFSPSTEKCCLHPDLQEKECF